ncbi:hypothetical protein [Streptomonospora salina]|uniref:Uncharacterized protein n=1 Tax=Streptomonospora salina TaxID=104205 RepID=A0A841ECX7_9ACTN|nr:hypothetical protein [Streptomonospora salina]MBB6000254.1 hypothetical protein [Streptomonospora salina]
MSTARNKGTKAETAVVRFLRGYLGVWLPHLIELIDRHPLRGRNDVGDIRGVPYTAIQVKSTKRLDIAGALDSARSQAAEAGTDVYAAWIKRRGATDPARWYVVLDGEGFARLLLHYLTAEVRDD